MLLRRATLVATLLAILPIAAVSRFAEAGRRVAPPGLKLRHQQPLRVTKIAASAEDATRAARQALVDGAELMRGMVRGATETELVHHQQVKVAPQTDGQVAVTATGHAYFFAPLEASDRTRQHAAALRRTARAILNPDHLPYSVRDGGRIRTEIDRERPDVVWVRDGATELEVQVTGKDGALRGTILGVRRKIDGAWVGGRPIAARPINPASI
jgi:hypothetical protein